MKKLTGVAGGLALALTGCTLYSDVSVNPLLIKPSDVRRPASGVVELIQIGDYPRAVALVEHVESRQRQSYHELSALGAAELACGRLDAARRHLRRALDLSPPRQEAAAIAWDLSQTEFLANQYAAAREWADLAQKQGLQVRQWHLDYLDSLADVPIYTFSGARTSDIHMKATNPNVPRMDVSVNDVAATAVIDTGAVLSIMSEGLAAKTGVRSLGDFRGTFFGLLGEPITVRFALAEKLQLGKIEVSNVPVAVMEDSKLNFFVTNREPFRMDLLLGANLLKEMRVGLNFRHNRVRLTHLDPRERVPVANQNLFFIGFRPFVHTTINRKGWFLFVLDTGSEITFLNEAELKKTTVRNLQKLHGALLQGLGGSQKRGAKLEDVELGIDRWAGRFRHIPLYSTEQTNAMGIIGENFMKQFNVTIDFGSMRLTLEPNRPTASGFDFEAE